MRKDDEAMQEQEMAAAAGAASAPAQKPSRNVDVDVDETDEALLGKATLAKLAKTAEVEATPEPVAQAPAPVEAEATEPVVPVVEDEAAPEVEL